MIDKELEKEFFDSLEENLSKADIAFKAYERGKNDAMKQINQGHCKECKYFEYDSVAKVNGIPLIIAHEICKKWGDGCQTREDGYCFLFEVKESEDR